MYMQITSTNISIWLLKIVYQTQQPFKAKITYWIFVAVDHYQKDTWAIHQFTETTTPVKKTC